MKVTQLAAGRITASHEITVILRESEDHSSAKCEITWPSEPTITTPRDLNAVIVKAQFILARASVALANHRLRRGGR